MLVLLLELLGLLFEPEPRACLFLESLFHLFVFYVACVMKRPL